MCSRGGDCCAVTLVWLSSGLPADRSELAAALPPGFSLVPISPSADPNTAADVGVLPVGSLCVATVFETELLAQLAGRPAGVGLLVIGPAAADGVTAASSIPELAAAISQAATSPAAAPAFPAFPAVPVTAAATDPETAETPAPVDERARTPLRTRLIAAGAVALGLGIGGIVIGTTEGTSAATAARGGGFGNFAPQGGAGTGGFAGGGFRGQLPAGIANSPAARDVVACLRKQGITTPTSQLLQNSSDPKLRQAFVVCLSQLRGGATSSPVTGRP